MDECYTMAVSNLPVIQRKELMIPMDLPEYPWQKVGADLFYLNGANYLVVVDYYLRYPEIVKLTSSYNLTDDHPVPEINILKIWDSRNIHQ